MHALAGVARMEALSIVHTRTMHFAAPNDENSRPQFFRLTAVNEKTTAPDFRRNSPCRASMTRS